MLRLSSSAVRMLRSGPNDARLTVAETLTRAVPEPLLRYLEHAGTTIRVLHPGERFIDASASVDVADADVDRWPIPPAGLFVVAERTLYLRLVTAMTIGHEIFHAFDAALGVGGRYLSATDAHISGAYAAARERARFVTPYAAGDTAEYFAEAGRAMVGLNDDVSPWRPVGEAVLRKVDPAMHRIMLELFERVAIEGAS